MSTPIGTAYRIHKRDAAKFFRNGAILAVSDRGLEQFDVHPSTTVHSNLTITWEVLTELVDTWRNRYPNQRFYFINYNV